MCYREEAIECVKDHVLQIHKQIYAKYNDDFDRIYTEGYNSKSYTGRVIEPGKIYELSYLECTCPKVNMDFETTRCNASARDRVFYISCRNLNQTVISRFGLRIQFLEEATAVHSV